MLADAAQHDVVLAVRQVLDGPVPRERHGVEHPRDLTIDGDQELEVGERRDDLGEDLVPQPVVREERGERSFHGQLELLGEMRLIGHPMHGEGMAHVLTPGSSMG
jgi:hypothetical protein